MDDENSAFVSFAGLQEDRERVARIFFFFFFFIL